MSFYIWALIVWIAIAIVFFLTKEIADYFKEQIPQKLYNALYGYEVEIDD